MEFKSFLLILKNLKWVKTSITFDLLLRASALLLMARDFCHQKKKSCKKKKNVFFDEGNATDGHAFMWKDFSLKVDTAL